MTEPESPEPTIPYAPWPTCLHLIERMEKDGVPSRIDNTYLIGMAGGTQSVVKQALRSLDLIDGNGQTTPRLLALVDQPDNRPALVADLLRERYPRLTSLSLNATRGELDEAIKSYGLSGATSRKAASFYLSAATYAGLPLSPFIKPSRTGGGGTPGGTRRTGSRRPKAQTNAHAEEQTSATPPASKSMTERYFDLLLAKAEKESGDGADLLDRIERLVGVPQASADAADGATPSGKGDSS